MPRASDRHVPIAWKKVVALGKKWSWLEKNGYYVWPGAVPTRAAVRAGQCAPNTTTSPTRLSPPPLCARGRSRASTGSAPCSCGLSSPPFPATGGGGGASAPGPRHRFRRRSTSSEALNFGLGRPCRPWSSPPRRWRSPHPARRASLVLLPGPLSSRGLPSPLRPPAWETGVCRRRIALRGACSRSKTFAPTAFPRAAGGVSRWPGPRPSPPPLFYRPGGA